MNILRKSLITFAMTAAVFAVWAQKPGKPGKAPQQTAGTADKIRNLATKGTVYVFGVGDSMRDSTVYITPIQRIDGANLEKKTKFLLDRPYFSMQLKAHFSNALNDSHRLCIVYYTTNEKKAKKKQYKVRKDYLEEGALVQQMSEADFKFTPMTDAAYESAGEKVDTSTVTEEEMQ